MVWVALPELIRVCLYQCACGSAGIKSLAGTTRLSLLFQGVALSLWHVGGAPWKPSWSWNQPLEPWFCAVCETP